MLRVEIGDEVAGFVKVHGVFDAYIITDLERQRHVRGRLRIRPDAPR